MKNIQGVSDSYLCSACGACKAICPKDAIEMKRTSMGRLYAKVSSNCIDCGLCTKICPSLIEPAIDNIYCGEIKTVYTGRATDDAIFENAQSGGACTAVLKYLFDEALIDAAIVCRMSWGIVPVVEGVVIDNVNQLCQTQKSCYTPVDILSSLPHVKNKKCVAVVGLPCHMQGLTLLQKYTSKFSNVRYKLGLICDRTLCSSIQDTFAAFRLREKGCQENIKIDWRRKSFTYNNKFYRYETAPVVVYSKTHPTEYIAPNVHRFLLKDFFTPPRCRVCGDKINTTADIVFGDPWRMKDVDLEYGESVIIVRTELGLQIVDDMKSKKLLSLKTRRQDEVVRGQLMDERKKTVTAYAQAFKVLPVSVNSYLLSNKEENSDGVVSLEKEFSLFKQRESLSREAVVRTAVKMIDQYEKIHNNPVLCILSKVYHKIKSLKP